MGVGEKGARCMSSLCKQLSHSINVVVLEFSSVVRMPPLWYTHTVSKDLKQVLRNRCRLFRFELLAPSELRKVISDQKNPYESFIIG